MNALLLTCQFVPLVGLVLIVLIGNTEKKIANISFWATHALGISIISLLTVWGMDGFGSHEFKWLTLIRSGGYEFPLIYYFDKIGAAYLFCTWIIFSVIVRYCRYYMHREVGVKRFFVTIFAFVFGLNIVILSGLLDMLFIGWEIVGISSFLLIAYYRHRVQPIRNAIRAYTVYRFCDLGLLLAVWLSDLLLHGNNHFSDFANMFNGIQAPPGGLGAVFALSLFVMIAAIGKSAQFPFCYWLPRAMEGPTPSSAIFYGALSVHLGVFVLLRTKPVWAFEFLTRAMVFGIGFLTVLFCSLSERAQSNIKGQIAYASITQVGFMFIELALGLESWVLVHFLGNAFLRCYQLLVSPSVVAHMLRVEGSIDAIFDPRAPDKSTFYNTLGQRLFPEVIKNSIHVLALQEFNLELIVRSLLWDPIRVLGNLLNSVQLWVVVTFSLLGVFLSWVSVDQGLVDRHELAIPFAVAMALASASGYSQRRNFFKVWFRVGLSCLLAAATTWLTSESALGAIGLYLSGILPAWILGRFVIKALLVQENYEETPFMYRGLAEKKPVLSMLFLLCFLSLVSFPITPAFLGQDLLLFHVSQHHPAIIVLLAISFVVNGIATANIFVRISMGRPVELSSNTTHVIKRPALII